MSFDTSMVLNAELKSRNKALTWFVRLISMNLLMEVSRQNRLHENLNDRLSFYKKRGIEEQKSTHNISARKFYLVKQSIPWYTQAIFNLRILYSDCLITGNS